MNTINANNVIVIGAGFSGLAAADALNIFSGKKLLETFNA